MKFLPTFSFEISEVYDPLIRNFRVWALDKRVPIFFWPIRVKMGDIWRAVKIWKLVRLTSKVRKTFEP